MTRETQAIEQLHVLHVAQPHDGGVPRVVAQLAADQVRRGWQVTVACPHDSESRTGADAAGAAWREWPAARSPGPSVPGEARRMARICLALNPDVVHLHSAKAGLAGRLALRGRRATIYQPHAWSFEAAGHIAAAVVAWERWAARWADMVVCVSEGERARGEAVGVRARFTVAANGVDLDALRTVDGAGRRAARRALHLADAPLALLVGRVDRQKGIDLLLDAWPAVRAAVPDARLSVVGDGPERAALAARNVAGVTFHGRRADVATWLAACNVLVSASRWEAGLTLVAMEAMARGRPVIAFATAGMREGMGQGTGQAVALGDVPALAAALAERLSDPALADREGLTARRRVEVNYDQRNTAARLAKLTEELAAERRLGGQTTARWSTAR